MATAHTVAPRSLERIFLQIIRGGIFVLAFVPLIVAEKSFFPYITGKNFLFRVVVEIIGSLWIALAVADKNYRPRRDIIFWALLLFIGIASLATIFSVDAYRSFWSNYERMEGLITYLHLFWLFLVVGTVFTTDRDFAKLFFVSLGVSAFISIWGILEKFQLVTSLTGGGRIFSTLGNSIYLAVYLLFHLFLSAWVYVRARNSAIKWVILGVFILNVVGFLLAESRGALVGLAGGIFIAILLAMRSADARRTKFALGGILLLLALLPLAVVRFQSELAAKKIPVISRLASISLREPTASSRLMIWGMAWEGIKERPILGWGLENFQIPYAEHYNPSLFGNEAWFDRTHSVVLDWFVHAGILGGLSYLALFGAVLWTIRRLCRLGALSREEGIIAASLISAYLIQNLFVFDNITSHILFFSFLGFLAHRASALPEASSAKTLQTKAERNSKTPSDAQKIIVPALFLIAGLVLAVALNLKPFLLSRSMIRVFNEAGAGDNFSESLAALKKLVDTGTFGQREVREQLTNLANTVAVSEARLADHDKVALFDLVIKELEKETEERFSPKHHVFLGRISQQFFSLSGQNFEEAKRELERAHELAPTYIQNRFSILELYLAKKDNARVEQELEALAALKPASGSFWRTVMLAYIFIGQGDRAVRTIFDIASAGAAPDDLPFLIERAILTKQNNAAFLLLKASEIYGGFGVNERLRLAELLVERRRYGEAIAYAEEAAALDPAYADEVQEFIKSIERLPGFRGR